MPRSSVPKDRSSKRPKSTAWHFAINPQNYIAFIEAIQSGMSLDSASWYAGLKPATVRDWLKKGEALYSTPALLHPGGADNQLLRFFEDTKKAQANFEHNNLETISGHSNQKHDGQWQASAWLLERRRPDNYSQKAVVDQLVEQRLCQLLTLASQVVKTETWADLTESLGKIGFDLKNLESRQDSL